MQPNCIQNKFLLDYSYSRAKLSREPENFSFNISNVVETDRKRVENLILLILSKLVK